MPQTELGLLNHKEWSIKTSFFGFNWYTITPPRWYTFSPALTLQIVTTSTFIFYCLYSVKAGDGNDLRSEKMMLTIPFVTYGIFRYLYLIYHKEDGGSPTEVLLTDRPLLTCVTLWLMVCIYVIYWLV